MALPSSGAISLNQMHVEVGGASGTQVSINDADIRALIGKGSGVQMSFSEWYGASASDVNIQFNGVSYNHTGKFASTQTGVTPSTYTPYIGSWVDNSVTTSVGTRIFTMITSQNGGILPSNIIGISGNYNGQTFQQATGYRYLKYGSVIFMDSNGYYSYTQNQVIGNYVSAHNHTVWVIEHSTNSLSYSNIVGQIPMFLSN